MNILITGGSGFIGRSLCEQLSKVEGYKIFCPSSKELNLLDELCSKIYIANRKINVVIHAATWNATKNTEKDSTKVLENNLRMFYNLIKCQHLYEKMVYYGSGAEFNREMIPSKVNDYESLYIPEDQYGFSKYIMNQATEKYLKNVTNLRLFGCYGKYEDWKIRFISVACIKAINNLPITINQDVMFDYLYIDDLVNITKIFIDNDMPQKSYNICTSDPISLLELACKVRRIAKKNIDIKILNPKFGREYRGDNSLLMSQIKYDFTPIDEGISKLYNYYVENSDKFNPTLIY